MVTARDDGLAGATKRSNEGIDQNKLPVHGRGIPMGDKHLVELLTVKEGSLARLVENDIGSVIEGIEAA
jgi:hypothetical protein